MRGGRIFGFFSRHVYTYISRIPYHISTDVAALVDVQRRVHLQYRYVLVDEFQDTTVVQMKVSAFCVRVYVDR